MRQDRKRRLHNLRVKESLKQALKIAKNSSTPKNISAAYAAIDTASKKQVIHKNKANRLKSRLTARTTKQIVSRKETKQTAQKI